MIETIFLFLLLVSNGTSSDVTVLRTMWRMRVSQDPSRRPIDLAKAAVLHYYLSEILLIVRLFSLLLTMTAIQLDSSGNYDGCPTNADSCPGYPGFDTPDNCMSYYAEVCVNRFTPDQIERMQMAWENLRTAGGEQCECALGGKSGDKLNLRFTAIASG